MITLEECQQAEALVAKHGSMKAAARETGKSFGWFQRRLNKVAEHEAPIVRGRVGAPAREEFPLPERDEIFRYILTCAQSNTHLHAEVWRNLLALSHHYDADILVSTFTYDLGSYGVKSVKKGKEKSAPAEPWYASEVLPYVRDESIQIAPGLVWCGEMNILPTAVRPLSGFESYTGRASGIFPHVKFAMESIASGKHEGTKFNYTTGTVTQRNYIAKTAGFKAEFHHGYGALLVEVDHEGNWWARQLNADSDGTICDLDLIVHDGIVTAGNRVEAINWGDIHVGTVDDGILRVSWEPTASNLMDSLRPKYQFLHDVLDFRSRNHHDSKNHHKQFQKFIDGTDDVVAEMKKVANFIDWSSRSFCQTVVVDSNHDNAAMRWLREADYRHDQKNAVFFLAAQLEVYKAMLYGRLNFHLLEFVLSHLEPKIRNSNVKFLREDESFIICPDSNGGIECGMHGHLGPNGRRGSPAVFAKMGRKSNTGHTHSAGIHDGNYCAGITGSLEQGYNVGPSSWSISSIVTYETGKRAIVTNWDGKWHAPR